MVKTFRFLNEQVAAKKRLDASQGVYAFSDMNPYVGHPNPLKEGQELFRKGLLSEAVLALEAEVMKNPENAEGWRLLGVTHAENDDDQQGAANRGASIRLGRDTEKAEKGYFEVRRLASNMDPYVVTSMIVETTILWKP
ncbi:hypothetical protein PTKIN_Ptkin16aG0084100 [Pterospermum kingtungense]